MERNLFYINNKKGGIFMDKNTKKNATVNMDLIEYFFHSKRAYMNDAYELSLRDIFDRIEDIFSCKDEDIMECIDGCFVKKFLFDKNILNQPVLDHLHNGTMNYFILQDNGIEKFGSTDRDMNEIFVIMLDTENNYIDFCVYDRILLETSVDLEPVYCSSVKKVLDIVPLIIEYTDLFHYPDLFPYEVLA